MDERVWTDRPLGRGEQLGVGRSTVTRGEPTFISLISGNLEGAIAQLCPGAPVLGLLEDTTAASFAIRMSRHQAAVVTQTKPTLENGWHEPGFALSRADDRYVSLVISGPESADILSYALTSPLPASSPSAAVRFAGTTVLITRRSGDIVLWVDPPALTYLTSYLVVATKGAVTA